MLLVAHRLSTVRTAHTIAVMAGGVVAEAGTYEELLAKEGGLFRALVARQLQQPEEEGGGEADADALTS